MPRPGHQGLPHQHASEVVERGDLAPRDARTCAVDLPVRLEPAQKAFALARICLGFVFLWGFLDKCLGSASPPSRDRAGCSALERGTRPRGTWTRCTARSPGCSTRWRDWAG